jgi:hypothetical protein
VRNCENNGVDKNETERYKSMVSNTCEVFADFGFKKFKKLGLIKFKKINYVTLGRQN